MSAPRAAVLLGALLALAPAARGDVAVPAPAPTAAWSALGEGTGLSQTHSSLTNSLTPAWFDLDGDERPEPMWWSYLGSVYLDRSGDTPTVAELEIPAKLKQVDGLPLFATPLDADGDGDLELLVVGRELVLLNHAGGPTFTVAKSMLPALPGAHVNDVAVGDLNQDGLPDVVLALGLGAFDRADLTGLPDLVLMNLGHGRFERHRIEPSRQALTRGIALVDMDGDGLLDLVESVDTSGVVGPGRVLLNRTETGSLTPSFEVSEYSWDETAFGMGVSIADLNHDGHLDIYSTSVGRDLLTYGSAEGTFTAQTHERGITHEWGPEALRVQWGSSLVDVNADGRLDILVRHGGKLEIECAGLTEFDIRASDLIYLQDAQGSFTRSPPPEGAVALGKGRHIVPGDWDGDGLPEVALGGLDGASDLWVNEAVTSSSGRAVTVRFRTHVSAWPPTGAVVTGRCDGVSWTRHLTSGGHHGATGAVEVHGAWETCSGAPEIDVAWPSGARTTHDLAAGATELTAEEPQWWTREGTTVTLLPALAGASKACIGGSSTNWNCCEATEEASCVFELTNLEDAVFASLDEGAPVVVLARSHWGMHIEPSPPRPGEFAYLNVMHVGEPSVFDPSTTSLWINGESLVLDPESVDEERQKVQYKFFVEEGSPGLYITLFPLNLLPEVTWTVPTGNSLDSDWLHERVYSNIIFDGETDSWHLAVFLNMLRDVSVEEQIDYPVLKTANGTPVPMLRQYLKNSVARLRLLVDPALLEEVDELRLQDTGAGYSASFAVPKPVSLEAAVERLHRVDGNLLGSTFYGAGDLSPLVLTLRDEEDRVLPPERSLLTLEVDGVHTSERLSIYDSTYNLTALMHGDGSSGPGEVRVLGVDGATLGAFPLERLAPPPVELDLAATTAELAEAVWDHDEPPPGSHVVSVTPRLLNGELAGAAGVASLEVEGAEVIQPLALDRSGTLKAHLIADPVATEMRVRVTLDGVEFATLSTPLEPTAEPEPDVIGGDLSEPAPAPSPSSRDDGCRSGPSQGGLMWLFILVALAVCRYRRGWT